MEVVKHTKNLGTLIVRPIEKCLAKSIIVEKHYSHKWNCSFGIINFGIFRENSDKCLGAAESLFIGACFKILRSEFPHIKAVQSFADGRLGC